MRKHAVLTALVVLAACSSSSSSSTPADGANGTDPNLPVPPPVAVQDGPAATLTLSPFEVAPHSEVFKCQTFVNPFGADVDVIGFESKMARGSHHLLLLEASGNTTGDLEDCMPDVNQRILYGAQTSESRYDLPPDVAVTVPARSGMRIQVHYLNPGAAPISAAVSITLHAAKEPVANHAGTLFLMDQSLKIMPRQRATVTKTCTVPTDTNLIALSGHMHSRGVEFTAESEGVQLFASKDWSESKPTEFNPPRALKAGQKITFNCTYQNETDQTFTWDNSADTGEMCLLSARVYPVPARAKLAAPNVVCY